MNLIKNSLSNLKGHKLRVFITLLWIIMGITSVILVSSIGNGLRETVMESVNKINPNKTRIDFQPNDYNMVGMDAFLEPFSVNDLEELSFIEGVSKIGPTKDEFSMGLTHYADAYYDKKMTYIDILEFKEDSGLKALYGRSFSIEDEDRKVIMITMQNATDLFGDPEKAIGKGITISGSIFEVIGIVDEPSVNNEDLDMYYGEGYVTSYMPKKSFTSLVNQYSYPDYIYSLDLIVSSGYDLFEVAYRVVDKLYELHPDINGSYVPNDPAEETKYLESMVSQINLFITVITAISMFVGGVGVMNIMYVSVMERQREIGIRRAIGAKPRHIMIQFLTESVFITICGGILGIIIGFIAVNYASEYLPFEAIVNFNSLFYAFVATVITGIVFGIVPAYKASKLDPIKAIYK